MGFILSVCMCIYVCICEWVVYVYVCVRMCVNKIVCVRECVCICVGVLCTVRVCMFVCMYRCVFVYVNVWCVRCVSVACVFCLLFWSGKRFCRFGGCRYYMSGSFWVFFIYVCFLIKFSFWSF